ncbi:FUSC family protein [Embleya hyalina]|uniref:Membrane protein n=1 Tax=Embleya hyalina TaxID=516124 RepID=A0A401YV85_9ACTN|nr:FUSC family protein [Embleya hyalina]GCD98489.1 membrane protein [Embleya hyalina]
MESPRATTVAMVSVLAAYGSALLLQRAAHLHADIVVATVVIALTLARAQRDADPLDRALAGLVLPPVAMLAAEIGALIPRHPAVGGTLFTLAMATTVELRRFAPRVAAAGNVAALPLVASLILPAVGTRPPDHTHTLWVGLSTLVTAVWVGAVHQVVASPRPGPRPTGAPAPTGPRRRLAPSTRMALQTGLALGAAFTLGHRFWPTHWSWAVLTTYLVCAGTRGRGDALHRGVLRTAGAAAGTLLATVLGGTFAAHDAGAVPVMFALLALGSWLRTIDYAYWAACVTAVLSLLYGYFGQPAPDLLVDRLAAILLGAALGVAAAWLILPIRTVDILRRRVADALAALTPILAGPPGISGTPPPSDHPVHRFDAAVAALHPLEPALRAHHRLVRRRRPGPHPVQAIDAVRACVGPAHRLAEAAPGHTPTAEARTAVAANVGAVRRAIGRRPGTPYRPLPTTRGTPGNPLADLDAALACLATIFRPAAPRPANKHPDEAERAPG